MKLLWGRDGSALGSRPSRIQVAEKTITYPKYEAAGRHFVDTFLLAQFYDVTARVLETYDLADIAAHLHIPAGSTLDQVSTDPDEVVTVFTDKATGKEIIQFPSQALIALAQMYDKDAGKVLDKSV